MRKLLLVLLLVISFTSCKETPQEAVDRLKREIVVLEETKAKYVKSAAEAKEQYLSLTHEAERMQSIVDRQNAECRAAVDKMKSEEKNHDMKLHPDKYLHVITLKIHQTTYTLSVGEYIKNKINDAEFDIPVDREFYNKCRVGQVINDPSLKVGSFIFNGDLSVYKVTISNKRIVKR